MEFLTQTMLRVFCEVVGVTLYRQAESVPEANEQCPYLDFPGLSLNNLEDWTTTKSTLDELQVETRVLVVNGAYDKDVLFKNIHTANHLGATRWQSPTLMKFLTLLSYGHLTKK